MLIYSFWWKEFMKITVRECTPLNKNYFHILVVSSPFWSKLKGSLICVCVINPIEALKGMEAVAEHINEMQKIYEEYGAVFNDLMRTYREVHPNKTVSFAALETKWNTRILTGVMPLNRISVDIVTVAVPLWQCSGHIALIVLP